MLRAPPTLRRRRFLRGRRGQCGLSLVELLVGAALGLFLVGGAISLFVGNLGNSRRLLEEARVNQDLRTAADLIARDLRRAGYWANAITGPDGNPHAAIAVGYAAPASAPNQIEYSFSRDTDDASDPNEQFGFRLAGGIVQMKTAAGIWQSITDPEVIDVTTLRVTPVETPVALGAACSKACPASGACPPAPTLTLRRYDVLLQAKATNDASVTRQLQESVRVRNDRFSGACPS